MDTLRLLRSMVADVHNFTERTIDGLTDDQIHWRPEGLAHPIAATYAHQVLAEDFFIQIVCQNTAPIFATKWNGKVGLSEMPPPPPGWDVWARTVSMDVASFRRYAGDVYRATDDYLGRLSDKDLDRQVQNQLTGSKTIVELLTTLVLHHSSHTGENAAIKGLQQLRGYPS